LLWIFKMVQIKQPALFIANYLDVVNNAHLEGDPLRLPKIHLRLQFKMHYL
jgi:hypothetical protein